MSGKPIDEAVVTDALIADLLPAALIFAENEEHLDHARQRAKTILLETLTAAQQQGQAVAWMTPGGDVSRSFYWCLERCLPGQEPQPLYTAPPSAPVGVDVLEARLEAAERANEALRIDAAEAHNVRRQVQEKNRELSAALAQQPAAVDEVMPVLVELVATLAATGTVTGGRIYFPERQTLELLKRACAALATQHQEPKP